MHLTRLLPLAALALLCLLPALLHSTHSSAIAQAASNPGRNSAQYARGGDLDDDEEEEPVRRRPGSDSSADAHLLQLRMLHALGAEPFSARGDVSLNFAPKRGSQRAITFSPSQSLPSKKAVRAALEQNALYRVKFVAEGEEEPEAITTSVPICALLTSHFHENFLFHVDPYGKLIGVGYKTPLACSSTAEARAVLDSSVAPLLQPKGKVSFGRPGEKAKPHIRPHFDTSAQGAAAAVGAEAPVAEQAPQRNADGSPAPKEQTFWQKYWLYIVPVGIFVLLQAFMAPPEQAAGVPAAGAGPKR